MRKLPKPGYCFIRCRGCCLRPYNSSIELFDRAASSNDFEAVKLAAGTPRRVRRKFAFNFGTAHLQAGQARDEGFIGYVSFVMLFLRAIFSRYISPAYDTFRPLCNAVEFVFKTEGLVSLTTCLGTRLVVDVTCEDFKLCNADGSMLRIVQCCRGDSAFVTANSRQSIAQLFSTPKLTHAEFPMLCL